jgi:N utilization substance protein B
MATPSDVRRLALVALYQFDARPDDDRAQMRKALSETVLHSTDETMHDDEGLLFVSPQEPFNERDERRAFELAQDAFAARASADREFDTLAPEWPSRRLAPIDRTILRLAHFEMTSGRTPPKVAVNEAVELAKAFSTEKSPSFINGLLSKVLKRLQAEAAGEASPATPEAVPTEQHADAFTDADLERVHEADSAERTEG